MVAHARRGKPHEPEDPGDTRDREPSTPGAGKAPSDQQPPPNRVAVPSGLVPDGERALLVLKPHWWFVILRTPWSLLVLSLVAVLSLGMHLAQMVPPALALIAPWVWWGAGLWALALVFVNILRRHVRWYVLTPKRVIRVGGILRRVRVEVPTTSVRMIATDEPIVQRAAGIGAVLFGSAATGGVEVAWTFIEAPGRVADRVRAHVPDRPQREPRI